MSTNPPTQKDEQPTTKIRASRSPAYPALALGEAIDMVRKIWDAQRKQESHIDSTLKTLGYSARSGRALRVIAALNHYGLIEESGSKDSRKIRLSETAQDILHLPETDPRKTIALKQSALLPTIHAALWERYGALLPDDNAIRPYLIRDKGYNDDAVSSIISNYRATFALAKLDKEEDSKPDETEGEKPESGKVPDSSPSPPKTPSAPFTPMTADTNLQEMPILVGPGRVARVPFPMTEDDFELLLGTLQLWKKKLVKKPESTTDEPPTS